MQFQNSSVGSGQIDPRAGHKNAMSLGNSLGTANKMSGHVDKMFANATQAIDHNGQSTLNDGQFFTLAKNLNLS